MTKARFPRFRPLLALRRGWRTGSAFALCYPCYALLQRPCHASSLQRTSSDCGRAGLARRRAWNGEGRKDYLADLPAKAGLAALAATIKARWVGEQAHQQLKEERGLESRSLARLRLPCADDDDRLRLPPAIAVSPLRAKKYPRHRRRRSRRPCVTLSRTHRPITTAATPHCRIGPAISSSVINPVTGVLECLPFDINKGWAHGSRNCICRKSDFGGASKKFRLSGSP